MKKHISLLLVVFLLLSLCGCQEKRSYQSPVNFYYASVELSYDAACTAICEEIREGNDYASLDEAFLAYLQGPESPSLKSPFPAGLRLISAEMEGSTLHLTLSDQLSQLSSLALTIACGCLALTGMGLTQAQQVTIRAENNMLGGEKMITMDRDTLGLIDGAQQGRA